MTRSVQRKPGEVGGDAFLRAVLEAVPAFIAMITPAGEVLYINRVSPYVSMDDVVGRSIMDWVEPAYRERARLTLERVAETGESSTFDNVAIGARGNKMYFENRVGPVLEDGVVVALALVSNDVTDRRQLEEHLRHAQKMDAVGKLAGGIAHNFNNMLMGILPNVQLAERKAPPELRSYLREAREGALRAAELVRQLVLFAVPHASGAVQDEAVGDVVRRAVEFCQKIFPREIAISLSIAGDLPRVAVDAGQIEHALVNICVNARDALLERNEGTLELRVSVVRVPAGATELSSASASPDVEHIRIRVADTGVGMSPEVRERIFEPFFTTKEVGQGTGLGLATTYAIVVEHGGTVACRSAEGEGTVFDIYLLAGGSATGGREIVPVVEQGKTSVLVVDDERLVRRAIASVLDDAGYRALEAADGNAALELVATRPGEVDLVLLDLSMPRLRGAEVLRRLHELVPDLPVLVITGGSREQVDGAAGVLHKPIMPRELIAAVSQTLGQPMPHVA